MTTPLLIGACALALSDAVYSRYRLRKLKMAQADAVAMALDNSVMVDGVELPKPTDVRWKIVDSPVRIDGGGQQQVFQLRLGGVAVDTEDVWSGGGRGLPRTRATQNYCDAVWKAYRSRVARKAIDSTS